MEGVFKILVKNNYSRWEYFLYRTTNGVMEIKNRDNRFAVWQVGEIPEGAILINNE